MTPEQIDRIRRVAASGDPFMQGALWMLIQMTQDTPEPKRATPETSGRTQADRSAP